jgi:hypothetical protein
MGLASQTPVGVNNNAPAMRDAVVGGTIVDATPRWLVLKGADGRSYWIPREMILLIEFTDGR